MRLTSSAERKKIRDLNLPGSPWAISTACCGRDLYLYHLSVVFFVTQCTIITKVSLGHQSGCTKEQALTSKEPFTLVSIPGPSDQQRSALTTTLPQAPSSVSINSLNSGGYCVSPCLTFKKLHNLPTENICVIILHGFQDDKLLRLTKRNHLFGTSVILRKATISFVMSVRPHETTCLPLDGFS